jgi:hypothetical protein
MNEADRLFKMLLDYAKEMGVKRCYDVAVILEGYDRKVLSKYSAVSPLARRWSAMIKEYRQVDPREQSTLTGFC